ncbi:hypothetical protein CIL05_21700, partial [Virgibacillus profundi]
GILAVIPAPIAYTKVVAVKKLVVGFLFFVAGSLHLEGFPTTGKNICRKPVEYCHGVRPLSDSFTLRKIECSKQATRLE